MKFWNLSPKIAMLINGFFNQDLSQQQLNELDDWILRSDSNLQQFESILRNMAVDGSLPAIRSEINPLVIKLVGTAAMLIVLILSAWIFTPAPAEESHIELPNHKKLKLADLYKNAKSYSYIQVNKQKSLIEILPDAPSIELRFVNVDSQVWKLLLPDSSEIRILPDSRLNFPAATHKMKRRLALAGQAYFKVAASTEHAFEVSTPEMIVRAMGTSFFINTVAENDETMASLKEGSLLVKTGTDSTLLLPGHTISTKMGHLEPAGVDEFIFQNTPLKHVLMEISAWYGVELIFPEMVPGHLNGRIPRSMPLTDLLFLLNKMGEVSISFNGDTILVKK